MKCPLMPPCAVCSSVFFFPFRSFVVVPMTLSDKQNKRPLRDPRVCVCVVLLLCRNIKGSIADRTNLDLPTSETGLTPLWYCLVHATRKKKNPAERSKEEFRNSPLSWLHGFMACWFFSVTLSGPLIPHTHSRLVVVSVKQHADLHATIASFRAPTGRDGNHTKYRGRQFSGLE